MLTPYDLTQDGHYLEPLISVFKCWSSSSDNVTLDATHLLVDLTSDTRDNHYANTFSHFNSMTISVVTFDIFYSPYDRLKSNPIVIPLP